MWKKENLRKNFLRVKQIADQNLGRAEKSEVLTEDQHVNEKRVDVVKQVSHNLVKKVTTLLEAPPGTDAEKRLKKLPETSLSHTLIESAALLGPETLMGAICQQCGECQSVLAREELQCELDIEREVLAPLQTIAEVDIPSIMKLRKQLSKSTLDMDSAKSRFNSAVRQSHVPGANMASAAAKADAVRDEYEEACNKMETIKDNLNIELCHFISKESQHSSRLVALLEAQATYHKNALNAIEDMIPKMKSTIEESEAKPLFGMALEDHLRVMDRDICLILEACILTLLDIGMDEEGLFRIAGSALKMKKLKACFDAHAVDMVEFFNDPHTVAGVLKQYLRELPEPMLTFDLYSEFMHATQLPHEQKLQALYSAVCKLPLCNYNNFRYLVKFLAVLAEKSQVNKMTPSNIAIVMGPNLLWAREESGPNMLTAGTVSSVMEAFILHADYFFPGDLDFHLTGRGRAPPSPRVPTPHPANLTPQVSLEEGPQVQGFAWPLEPAALPGSGKERTAELVSRGRTLLSQRSESSAEIMLGGPRAGEGGMSAARCNDGDSHHPLPPPTNLSLVAGSAPRQRPTMLSSSPPVLGPKGSRGAMSTPNLSQGGALSGSSAWPGPTSPTSPGQSVHFDMYSTMFALHSLGEGGGVVWSDYLTRVRALWDEQFQSTSLPPPPPPPPSSSSSSSEGLRGSSSSSSAGGSKGGGGGGGGEIEFSVSGGYPPDSPSQEFVQDSVPLVHCSPGVVAYSPTPSGGGGSPGPANTSPSVGGDALSPSADSSEGGGASPRVQRRMVKKPAPPPPPDRSYSVAVTASVGRGSGNGSAPSQAGAPTVSLTSPETPPLPTHHDGDKRLSGPERPHGPPPERPSTRPPDRPKAPVATPQSNNQLPATSPGGHQRSASTGAMTITPTTSTSSSSSQGPNPSPGSASQESLQPNTAVSQEGGMPSGTATLGRYSTMRPSRQADSSFSTDQGNPLHSGTATLGRHSMRPSRQPPPPEQQTDGKHSFVIRLGGIVPDSRRLFICQLNN
ncbi:hypothetical protein ACOMHN_037658 [Nucella lapillus]